MRLSPFRDGRVAQEFARRDAARTLHAFAHWKVLALQLPVAAVPHDEFGEPPHDPHAEARSPLPLPNASQSPPGPALRYLAACVVPCRIVPPNSQVGRVGVASGAGGRRLGGTAASR
jgi:hypothetical protein